MVQSDFFDIIDEEEDLEPQHSLATALLMLGTAFMAVSLVLLVLVV